MFSNCALVLTLLCYLLSRQMIVNLKAEKGIYSYQKVQVSQ